MSERAQAPCRKCGETRQSEFRASEPGQCKACRRAYNNARKLELRRPDSDVRVPRATLGGLLVDVAQLLDGWHQDGTAWSEWDETVRRRVGAMLEAVNQ